MEILADKTESKINQPVPFSVRLISMLSIVLWLIGFLRLTQEERLAAGINADVEKRVE